MSFNIYKFDDNLQSVQVKNSDLNKIEEILKQSFLNAEHIYECGEEAIQKTSFGISKTKEDFIEITCHRNAKVTVHSDRLYYDSMLSKLLSFKNHFFIETNQQHITLLIKNYILNDREDFEASYKDFLCR